MLNSRTLKSNFVRGSLWHGSRKIIPKVTSSELALLGIMKLLPATKLHGVNYDLQLRRFPVHVKMPPRCVVGVPSVEHPEQDFMDLLGVSRLPE
jgi:hypothetical protein